MLAVALSDEMRANIQDIRTRYLLSPQRIAIYILINIRVVGVVAICIVVALPSSFAIALRLTSRGHGSGVVERSMSFCNPIIALAVARKRS